MKGAVRSDVAEHPVQQIRIRRDGQVLRRLRRLAEALVVAEEENPVAFDRSAEPAAELMAAESGLATLEALLKKEFAENPASR